MVRAEKIPTVAEDLRLMKTWQESTYTIDQWAYRYFGYSPDRVNPHNLYLLMAFETGYTGLLVFLAMLQALFKDSNGLLNKRHTRHMVIFE